MSEPRSRRGRILKNLQRQLETISKDAGYTTNVTKVTMNVRNWAETPEAETPIIYIIDANTRYIYGAGRNVEHEWTIDLFGVMKNRSQLDMEELIADIEECLFNNGTLSFDGTPGPISQLRIQDIITDAQLFSEIEGSQLFKMTVIFKYVGCVDNPR